MKRMSYGCYPRMKSARLILWQEFSAFSLEIWITPPFIYDLSTRQISCSKIENSGRKVKIIGYPMFIHVSPYRVLSPIRKLCIWFPVFDGFSILEFWETPKLVRSHFCTYFATFGLVFRLHLFMSREVFAKKDMFRSFWFSSFVYHRTKTTTSWGWAGLSKAQFGRGADWAASPQADTTAAQTATPAQPKEALRRYVVIH